MIAIMTLPSDFHHYHQDVKTPLPKLPTIFHTPAPTTKEGMLLNASAPPQVPPKEIETPIAREMMGSVALGSRMVGSGAMSSSADMSISATGVMRSMEASSSSSSDKMMMSAMTSAPAANNSKMMMSSMASGPVDNNSKTMMSPMASAPAASNSNMVMSSMTSAPAANNSKMMMSSMPSSTTTNSNMMTNNSNMSPANPQKITVPTTTLPAPTYLISPTQPSSFTHPFVAMPKSPSAASSSPTLTSPHQSQSPTTSPYSMMTKSLSTTASPPIPTYKEFRSNPNTPPPILLELFTSEGCSSCPPSERYLTSLRKNTEVLWNQLVPVCFHVDYWNYLGWTDVLSSKDWTRRQRGYASEWGSGRVYTPCFVKDGMEFGSRASTPKILEGRLEDGDNVGGELVVRWMGAGCTKEEGVWKFEVEYQPAFQVRGARWILHLALLGNGISHRIYRGENKGETLEHEFAVLGFKEVKLGDESGRYMMDMKFEAREVLGRKDEDPNSFANVHEIKTTHLHLDLKTNFVQKIISGSVLTTATVVADKVTELVLDTSFVNVKAASMDGKALNFKLGETSSMYGTPLHISFPSPLSKGSIVNVKIEYETTSKCTAAQWLEPSQTVGKKHPYMFTQCQAIHARSLLPVQDTPAVKLTYSASVAVPKVLRALMSAIPVSEETVGEERVCKFEQKISIPSYLIAMAVGNLEGRRVGPRSTVWSEPEVVEQCEWEFVDTEKFIAAGEKLLTPYIWGIYDLLIMENPSLTFATPSLLAGDRSLVDVVAHEIAHSWAGNLVTTQNWEHFWLNEGFTVCIERKIMGLLHGESVRHFSAIIGEKALKESVKLFEEMGRPEFSSLRPVLDGVDPDDAFSSVPYEKGFHLLFYLENILGGADVFNGFLKNHFETFSHKSITTDDFLDNLYKYFKTNYGDEKVKILDSVDWKAWFNAPGMPPVKNEFDQTLAKACKALADRWDAARTAPPASIKDTFTPDDLKNFSSTQTVVFLESLLSRPPLPISVLDSMESIYNLTTSRNCEIRHRWQMLNLQSNRESIFPEVVQFVTTMGRMKYVRTLYRALFKCGDKGKELARKTFKEYKSFYHPICATMVEKDIM
ncbi:Leukotriene A-4 hydrolase [Chytridiales sp. JEL 0842]|nr:Leukotriene A-4 hydrolase [Chytridiales sp. JEL 0842]